MHFKKQANISEKTLTDAVALANSSYALWSDYRHGIEETECTSCNHFNKQKGGAIKKKVTAVLNEHLNPMDETTATTSKTPPKDIDAHDIPPTYYDDASTSVMMAETSDMTIEANYMTTNTSDMTAETSDMTTETNDMTTESIDMTTETSVMTTETNDMTRHTSDVATETSDITIGASDMTLETSDISDISQLTVASDETCTQKTNDTILLTDNLSFSCIRMMLDARNQGNALLTSTPRKSALSVDGTDSHTSPKSDTPKSPEPPSASHSPCVPALPSSFPSTSQKMPDSSSPEVDDNMTQAVLVSLLNRSVKLPLDPLLEKVTTHLIKTKLETSKEKNTLIFKTGGQNLIFQKRIIPRKLSSLASSPTKKKRALESKRFVKGIGGSSRYDHSAQIASNFKRNSKQVKADLFKKSNLKVVVDAKSSLAFKEALNLTISKQRDARRILKDKGVILASEKKEREVYKNIVKNKVLIDAVSVKTKTTTGEANKQVPMGRAPDLKPFVFRLLDEYEEQGSLLYEQVGIPENEIWLKIGGDHGQGSLKICLEIANLEKPNAREHTHILSMIEAKDTYEVLEEATLNLNFGIMDLKRSLWKGKNVKIFLFGDYSFLLNLYGLSGAAGTYPCLCCETSNLEIKNSEQGTISDRTLENIKRNFNNYKQAFERVKTQEGRKKLAAAHMNCVRKPLLDIELDMVVPMYLHILLGVVMKLHTWLVEEADAIDKTLAFSYSQSKTDDIPCHFTLFKEYVSSIRKKNSLGVELIEMEGVAANAVTVKDKRAAEKRLSAIAGELKQLNQAIEKGPKSGSGPVAATIEKT